MALNNLNKAISFAASVVRNTLSTPEQIKKRTETRKLAACLKIASMVAASASVILFTVIPSVFTLIFSGFMCLVAYDLSKVSDHFSKAADDALSDFHVQWKRLTHQQSAIVIHFTEGTIVLGPLLRTLSVFSDSNDIF